MFCTNCGQSIDDTATECTKCGAPVEPTVPSRVIPNYLVWAILVTLFCCVPSGIVSIVYSAQVNSKLAAGDIAGAERASKTARTWIIVSVSVGLVVVAIYAVAAFFGQ